MPEAEKAVVLDSAALVTVSLKLICLLVFHLRLFGGVERPHVLIDSGITEVHHGFLCCRLAFKFAFGGDLPMIIGWR